LNRYAYALGNPVRYRDPSGHRPAGACEAGEMCDRPALPVTPTPAPLLELTYITATPIPPTPLPSLTPTPAPFSTPSPLALRTPVPTPGLYWNTPSGHDANLGKGQYGPPIPFSAHKPCVGACLLTASSGSGVAVVGLTVAYRSSMAGTVTYYENGAYVVVSDSYDAGILKGVTTANLSLLRQVAVETTTNVEFGPFPLQTDPSQAGNSTANPITVWIPVESGAPGRVIMQLAIENMAEKAPAGVGCSYYAWIPSCP
jgi:hypothetical protein